ncbi:LysR family transcriptional regulator [Bradyrhizobium sp. LTSP857]|uniref:LysR family transcriptional regulator n=1 Tax=Bradyrhizobium sp. LTSP857 TaxID=1619231 RepID=UPI0009E4927C|nr:LysR family transcriptional regulator [Bradyrhizobium sp. LTSP857]
MNTPPLLELRLLRTFMIVAQELHYRRAADRLNATQSAVSLQIQELERRLAVTLLVRNRRSVALTAAGKLVYSEGEKLLLKAELLGKSAAAAHEGRLGIITVGTIGAATLEVLPRLVERARSAEPSLEFHFREMGGRDQLEALRRGDIDLGFVRSEARVTGLAFKTVNIEPVICLVPSNHRLAKRSEISIAELEGEAIVNLAREYDPAGHDLYISMYRSAGFEPRVVQEASQLPTILFAVAVLGCVSIGPASWRILRRDGVKLVPIAHPVPTISTRLVWNPNHNKPTVNAVLAAWGDGID